MSELSVLIGERIRAYRKANGMTLQQLADRINRSKSTLSKYESGVISVDMDTLAAISNELKTHIYAFVDGVGEVHAEHVSAGNFFKKASSIHLYYYDGRSSRVRHGVIKFIHNAETGNRVMLHMNVDEYKKYNSVEYLCFGTISSFDTFTCFSFEQPNGIGDATIYAYNPFGNANMVYGLLVTICKNPIAPGALKVALSQCELDDPQTLKDQLLINKDDRRSIRESNMFLVMNRS